MNRKTICVLINMVLTALSVSAFAQDTESKDAVIVITIYSKIKVEGMGCTSCFDSLSARISKLPYAQNVKKHYEKAMITFSMPSEKIPSKKSITKLVHESGLLFIDVEFSKTEIELEPDPVKVF